MPEGLGSQVQGNIFIQTRRRMAASIAYVQALAGNAEAEMKRPAAEGGAPWRDRTGHARAALYAVGDVKQVPNGFVVELRMGHGMAYGIWLEVANAGAYAIVGPTIQRYRPRVVAGMKRIWEGTPYA